MTNQISLKDNFSNDKARWDLLQQSLLGLYGKDVFTSWLQNISFTKINFNTLFKRRENLEIFNKKALYIYIREMTGADTPIITKVTKKLKSIYKTLHSEYTKKGYVRI